MTYCEGLGQINIARDSSALIRSLQYKLQQVKESPTTTVTKTPTKTTFTPAPTAPKLPVLVAQPTTVKSSPSLTPVFKPTVVAPVQTVGMKSAPAGTIVTSSAENVVSAFAKSPLPLIAVALGALFLLNRKGR